MPRPETKSPYTSLSSRPSPAGRICLPASLWKVVSGPGHSGSMPGAPFPGGSRPPGNGRIYTDAQKVDASRIRPVQSGPWPFMPRPSRIPPKHLQVLAKAPGTQVLSEAVETPPPARPAHEINEIAVMPGQALVQRTPLPGFGVATSNPLPYQSRYSICPLTLSCSLTRLQTATDW